MKNNIKYLLEVLTNLGLYADEFYSISFTPGHITLQGKYNSEFTKRFTGWKVDGGYLKKSDIYIFHEETRSIGEKLAISEIKISYTIILTD